VIILLVSSVIFYAYNNFWLLFLLVVSGLINSFLSYYICFLKKKKIIATIGVVFNVLLLAFFKYSPLISITFLDEKDPIASFLVNIPLPIGISFYTFEGISLLIDVYKGREKEKPKIVDSNFFLHLKKSFLFIVFFPHLIAGPILKANHFFLQIKEKSLKEISYVFVFRNLILGYFFKMVIADNLKEFTYWIEYPFFQSQSTTVLLTMLVGYSCQIFADFAGYSLIAIGLAALFGYQLQTNFNFPYIASSFQDFWKRWHISLSSFLKDYVYIPLGGNKKGNIRTYLNLMLTMIIGGLWHGAGWNYAVWGAFHGFLLAIERFLSFIKLNFFFFKILKLFFVFIAVTFAWLLFKLTNFEYALEYLKNIQTNYYLPLNWQICLNIFIYSLPVFFYHFFYLLKKNKTSMYLNLIRFDYFIFGIMLFLIFTNSGITGSFIYFQF
jgi:alginate O-acetyltransferase complex protein AlgI